MITFPKKQMAIKCLLVMVAIVACSCNLFCNGDFEAYHLTDTFTIFPYSLVRSYLSADECWYPKGSSYFHVKKVGFYPNNQICDLHQFLYSYKLCHVLTLEVGKLYEYHFDIGIHPNVKLSNVTVYLNSVAIGRFSKAHATAVNFTRVRGNFNATVISNEFCVGSSESLLSFVVTLDSQSTFVDNLDLFQVVNTSSNSTSSYSSNSSAPSNSSNSSSLNSTTAHFSNSSNTNSSSIRLNTTTNSGIDVDSCYEKVVYFHSVIDDFKNQVTLTSKEAIIQEFFNIIIQRATIKIDGITETNVQYSINQNTQMVIIVHLNRPCNLNNMVFDISSQISLPPICINFFLRLLHSSVIVSPLSDNQKNTIQAAQSVSSYTIKIFFSNYGQSKFFFLSYFFVNFVSFFNCLVFYNFLSLETQPSFSHFNLEQLAKNYFSSDLSITQVFQTLISKLNPSIQISISSLVDSSETKQKIQEMYNNFKWFKLFGATYDFLKNNFSTLIVILLLVVKISLFYLIRAIIQYFKPNLFKQTQKISLIVIVQLLCSAPFVIIAALQTMLKQGNTNFNQKLNQFCHHTMLIFFIILPFMYWVLGTNSFSAKREPAATNLDEKWQLRYNTISFSFQVLIPSLIIIRNKIAFFVLTFAQLLLLLAVYIKGFRYFKNSRKIYYGITLFILYLHHFCFLYFHVVSTLNTDSQMAQAFYLRMVGITVIYTVLVGSVLQLVDALLSILIFVVELIISKVKQARCKRISSEEESEDQAKKKISRISTLKISYRPTPCQKQQFYVPVTKTGRTKQILTTKQMKMPNKQIIRHTEGQKIRTKKKYQLQMNQLKIESASPPPESLPL